MIASSKATMVSGSNPPNPATANPPPSKPKGILKKPPTTSTAHAPPPSPPPSVASTLTTDPSTAARIRLLQNLRATELKPPVPLSHFETLLALPHFAPPAHSASNPHPSDTSLFLSLLREFTPSEYLDLIEERNCDDKCGYTLCARARRSFGGEYKLVSGRGGVARTAELNKWCSDACAVRALHLKVQLDNPSYERGGDGKMVVKLELREEKDSSSQGKAKEGDAAASVAAISRGTQADRDQLAHELAQLELDKQKQVRRDASALAAERGDPAGGWLAGQSRVEVTIQEKATVEPAQAPSQDEDSHLLIEGYKPTFGTGSAMENDGGGAESDEDDEFPTIRL